MLLREKKPDKNERYEEVNSNQESYPCIKRSRIKFVTKLLMDSKYGLMDDLNYIRGFPEHNDNASSADNALDLSSDEYAKKSAENSIAAVASIPRSTRIKADRVRIYLDFYYSILERCINIESTEHHHDGVEGVYNPLQVIRNRKLRKKYHEMPPRELSFQKAPVIAIKQFSKRPSKKMPWFLDLGERSSDLTWRTSHWDELVDPNGNLWFADGKDSLNNPAEGTHKETHRHHRPHLRRRPSSHLGVPVNSPYSTTAYSPSTPEIQKYNGNSISVDSMPSHLDLPTSRTENGDQRSFSEESEKSRLNRFEMMMGKKSKPWSRSPNMRQKSQGSVEKLALQLQSTRKGSYGGRTPAHSRASSSSILGVGPRTYMTPIDGNTHQRSTLLNAVPIQHARKQSQEKDEVQVEHVEEGSENTGGLDDYDVAVDPLDRTGSAIQIDEQLQQYWNNTKFIKGTLKIMQHRRITHAVVRRRGFNKRDQIKCDQNMDDIVLGASEVLNVYDEELNKALKIGNSIASSMLNDYSMRVETLISTSDRILSDINTTLTLKLKLFQENADRFGSLKMMRSQKLTKTLYRLLEFTIVLILWTVWFLVSIVRWIKYIVMLSFRAVVWMLW